MNCQIRPLSTSRSLTGTKKRIVEEAAKLFFDEGYHKVGIRRIASAVNRSSGTIYKHFECKEDILDAVLSDCLKIFNDRDTDYLYQFKMQIEQYKDDLEALRKLFFDPNDSKKWTEVFWTYKKEFNFIFFDSKGTRYENLPQKIISAEASASFECLKMFSSSSSRARELCYEDFETLISGHIATYASAIRRSIDYERFCKIVETSNWIYTQLFWTYVVPDELFEQELNHINHPFI